MKKKTPSSLEYETLLHELALQSWRRAMGERDFARALQNASKLTQSRDRFWRWQGGIDLALTHLCRGETRAALAALETAMDSYRDVPPLLAPAVEMQAHIFLETGDPKRTLALVDAAVETPVLRYLRGLALVRTSPTGGARVEAEALLRQEESRLTAPEPAGILLLFAHASTLAEGGDHGSALEAFESISHQSDALLYWPIPYVRSFACTARIRALRGERLRARSDWETFLSYWSGGDVDRDRVFEALHFVKA